MATIANPDPGIDADVALERRGPAAALMLSLAIALAGGASRAQSPAPDDVSATDLLNSMRSDVRIIARDNHELEEYRVGNNVYMVKVKPRNAPPYYLVDQDGSGNLQWQRGPGLERTVVPRWSIVRW